MNGVRIQILRFADDIAIIAQDEINLNRALESFDNILKVTKNENEQEKNRSYGLIQRFWKC